MPEAGSPRPLLLSAPDRDALLAALESADPAANPVSGPGPRLAVLDPTPERLATARRLVARGAPVRKRSDLWFSPAPLLAGGGGTAFVFPGLEADFAPRVDDVAELLALPAPPSSTATLGRHGTAVLAVGRLLDTALRRLRLRPDAVAGHSVGEWAAMICGGVVAGDEFDAMIGRADLDALRVPGVEFAVLGCPADRVWPELTTRPGIVVSHENSANQTVVCGPGDAVAELLARMRAVGVIGHPLPFRSGFHTPMLEPYLGFFREGLPSLRMRPADTPVWSATTARPFPADPAEVRELCLRHLVEPVRFRQVVLALHAAGIRVFVQAGPGQLGSLIEDTLRHDLPGAEFAVVPANSPHRSGVDQLWRCALALWTEGAEPDFAALKPASADPPAAPPAWIADWPGLARLTAIAAGSRPASELAAFLDETAGVVASVLAAAGEQELRVSLAEMPYLRDHCLMRQRPGWPVEEDLRPLVPATTMVTHVLEAAERFSPGARAVGAQDIRFHRWFPALPARTVPVHAEAVGDGRVHVRLGDYAEATVLLAERYPAPPPGWPRDEDERAPALTAQDMYRQRWMFHGPAYQGMTRTAGISATTLRGEITTPAAPGGLLDTVGQFLGQWLVERQPDRWLALPGSIARITLHDREPAPGTSIGCTVRVTGIDESTVTMDAQLTRDGVPVVSVHGWTDRRFDGSTVFREPGSTLLAERTEHGSWLLAEPWTDLASRELLLQRYAGLAERAEYERLPPARRRGWLLRLIVVKDAVRARLWQDSDAPTQPIHPAELRVHQSEDGTCHVTGEHGLTLPALALTVIHRGVVAEAHVHLTDGAARAARAARIG